jgi:hypothetical protein
MGQVTKGSVEPLVAHEWWTREFSLFASERGVELVVELLDVVAMQSVVSLRDVLEDPLSLPAPRGLRSPAAHDATSAL